MIFRGFMIVLQQITLFQEVLVRAKKQINTPIGLCLMNRVFYILLEIMMVHRVIILTGRRLQGTG